MIPRVFEGQCVYIVAGGPSLKGFDFDILNSKSVLAINRAHENCPHARVLWWTDERYWRKAAASLNAHPAHWKATCKDEYGPNDLPPWVHQYTFTGAEGFDENPAALRHGYNSAYAAMHLAIHLGAHKIVLLGVDMRHGPKGETHFHSGHTVECDRATAETFKDLMIPSFATLAPALAARQIEVVNASPDSMLTVWPRCSLEDAFR